MNDMTRRNIVLRILPAALLLPAGIAPARAAAEETTVKIDNFTFNPAELKIAAGSVVKWINEDDIPHTVVATNLAFKSKALDTGDTFTFTFATPGRFTYFCSLHPHMKATIVVSPPGS